MKRIFFNLLPLAFLVFVFVSMVIFMNQIALMGIEISEWIAK
jgi:hypothetical protein